MSCAPPLKPVFVIVALLADESFLIDFRVLTSWNPYLPNRTNVRFWRKADMAIALNDVRFRGGHHAKLRECPLLTQSGHRPTHISIIRVNSGIRLADR